MGTSSLEMLIMSHPNGHIIHEGIIFFFKIGKVHYLMSFSAGT
jgi:hypothetical protein